MNRRCNRSSQAKKEDRYGQRTPHGDETRSKSQLKQYLGPTHVFFAVDATSRILPLWVSWFYFLTWPSYHDSSFQFWASFEFPFPDGIGLFFCLLALHLQYRSWSPAQFNSTDLSVPSLSQHLITLLYSTFWSISMHMCKCVDNRVKNQML